MSLENYIKIFDNSFPVENISSLLQWVNKIKIEEKGTVGDNEINENIRKVKLLNFFDWHLKQKTKIHWCNYLHNTFHNYMLKYSKLIYPFNEPLAQKIIQMDLLKYSEGDFYRAHVDHFTNVPRTLSFILLLNNDYEGGEIEFLNPTTGQSLKKITSQPGRMVVWPSNFLYTHKINTISKGTRYSIVSWAL